MIALAIVLYIAALTFVLAACRVAGDADDAMDRAVGDLPHIDKGE